MAFPTTVINLTVEVALSADLTADPSTWAWTDATDYAFASGIRITRGGFDGSIQSPPSRCDLQLDNADGRWVPTNPNGAWYGQISKGTPIRVVVDEGTLSVRWTGFLTELPPRWDPSESMRWVPVVASGILRRLERGSTPLRSALVRTIAGTSTPPVRYWPAEDGPGGTVFAEYSGHEPMKLTGQVVTFASDGPAGSLPLPEFTTVSGCVGRLPGRSAVFGWTVACVFNLHASPSAEAIVHKWSTNGSLPVWDVTITPGSPDTITLRAFDSTGTQQLSDAGSFIETSAGAEAIGEWILLVISVTQDGANFDYQGWSFTDFGGSGFAAGTVNNQTIGIVTEVAMHCNSKTDGMHSGHFAVWDVDLDPSVSGEPDYRAIDGWNGEYSALRAIRLGQEQAMSVNVETLSSFPATLMGPQGADTFLNLLRECEAIGAGRLYEELDPTDSDSYLHMRHSEDLTNQDAVLTLNHDSGHLAPGFAPTDDDQQLRNDVTATRSGASGVGSSARVIATVGEHSNLTPANVGTYDDSVTVNVETDDQLPHHAGWRVNVGTVEGLRFPTVTLDFARNPGLIADWITCDIGSRITITNPPEGIAPDDIDLLIEGWVEVFGPKTWQVQLNCSPYAPWRGFLIADTTGDTDPYLGRLAGDEQAALRTALDSTTTGAINFDPNFYRWTTAADDFPLDITLKPAGAPGNGEVVTLSGISTSAATYVAAGAASHADNAAVTPALYAGSGIRQLILILAAIRSSGTGTLVTPTGYTRLPVFGETDNVQLFGKIDGGSESNPTVTPSGGSAGDTVSAFTFGFTVMPVSLEDLGDIVLDSVTQLNASAANIAYGGLFESILAGSVQLILGWKQDDYTSIAVPSGFTEILEASTTTGSDQSLYAAYRIDTTPAVVNGGSLVVTGGASAISRSAVCAIAGGIQVMTISARSVNGVVMSHAAGDRIAVHDPAVLAL